MNNSNIIMSNLRESLKRLGKMNGTKDKIGEKKDTKDEVTRDAAIASSRLKAIAFRPLPGGKAACQQSSTTSGGHAGSGAHGSYHFRTRSSSDEEDVPGLVTSDIENEEVTDKDIDEAIDQVLSWIAVPRSSTEDDGTAEFSERSVGKTPDELSSDGTGTDIDEAIVQVLRGNAVAPVSIEDDSTIESSKRSAGQSAADERFADGTSKKRRTV